MAGTDDVESELLVGLALDAGFEVAGAVPAGPLPTAGAYREWLAAGLHGEMGYLARPDSVEKRGDVRRVMPDARTVLVVGISCGSANSGNEEAADRSRGLIARFAQGSDYHGRLMARLEALATRIEQLSGRPLRRRAYVDTGPLLERELAARAGLGFIGKNTQLIHPRLGSWLLLGELLLDLDLVGGTVARPGAASGPHTAAGTDRLGPAAHLGLLSGGNCGRCTRCIDACPTGALFEPYRLDARRCLSYLTVELRGPIPHRLRPALGNRIFGCDACQEVCPWNRRSDRALGMSTIAGSGVAGNPLLLDLVELDDAAFRERYESTTIVRGHRRGLLRNVAVALGNWGDSSCLPGLLRLLTDDEPLVRGHAAWGIGRIGGSEAAEALHLAVEREGDEWVRIEAERALVSIPAQVGTRHPDPLPGGVGPSSGDCEDGT